VVLLQALAHEEFVGIKMQLVGGARRAYVCPPLHMSEWPRPACWCLCCCCCCCW
jgi:hypothetical protein